MEFALAFVTVLVVVTVLILLDRTKEHPGACQHEWEEVEGGSDLFARNRCKKCGQTRSFTPFD